MRACLLAVALVGCGDDDPMVLADAGADAGGTADAGADAGPGLDAGTPRCGDDVVPSWDLALGRWSTLFAAAGAVGSSVGRVPVDSMRWIDGELYVAGSFASVGPVVASNVAVWSELAGWRPLGEGLPEPVDRIVVTSDRTVYAASGAGVDRFRDGAWTRIATIDGPIHALELDPAGRVLAGGTFTRLGDVAADGLGVWDGARWEAIDHPPMLVQAIVADALGMCIAGRAGGFGAVACQAAAGGAWESYTPAAGVTLEDLRAIVRDDAGRLVVGGRLDSTMELGGVARFEGDGWEFVGASLSAEGRPPLVNALAHGVGTSIWAAGDFVRIGPRTGSLYAFDVAYMADDRWYSVGGVQGWLPARSVVAGEGVEVFVGGGFNEAFGPTGSLIAAYGVARWSGSAWSSLRHLGARTLGTPATVATRGTCGVYFYGGFQQVDDLPVPRFAQLGADDSVTAPHAGAAVGPVTVALGPEGTVYVGSPGLIEDHTGAEVFARVAKLESDGWHVIDPFEVPTPVPIPARVTALAVDVQGRVYAGGWFTDDPNPHMHHLMRWTEGRWEAVGARERAPVTGLLVAGDDLYVVEGMGEEVQVVSHWDGTDWEVLEGVTGRVLALALFEGSLVAAGENVAAGAAVARWSGSAWEPVGSLDASTSRVAALATFGDVLIAGGSFAVDAEQANVAYFDGSAWRRLGGGVSGSVESIAVTSRGLLLGGVFHRAGDVPSYGLARFEPPE